MNNRTVVITGGNRGIGLGIAEAFAQAGATLILAGLEPDTPEVAEQLARKSGARVTGHCCDITSAADRDRLAAAAPVCDVLINNAGLEARTPVADTSEQAAETFQRVMEINVSGTFEVTRALLPAIPGGGTIINTASIWGKTGVAEFSAYCASKHAIIGLTRSLSRELGPRGITVNAVCPGWVRTEASMRSLAQMSDALGTPEDELMREILSAQSLEGLMEPQDVASTYLFLASEGARNITGQTLTVDRGELMQ